MDGQSPRFVVAVTARSFRSAIPSAERVKMPRGTASRKDEQLLMSYQDMVRKLAWQAWRRLPAQTKMWVDVDDMVADAFAYILARAKYRYDGKRAAQSTFIWTGVQNLFLNYAMSFQTKKRFGWSVPLEDTQWMGREDTNIRDREALDALARTYLEASQPCKKQIVRWFGQTPVRAKRSAEAKEVYIEFRVLAHRNRLTKDDCRELMRAGVCIQT